MPSGSITDLPVIKNTEHVFYFTTAGTFTINKHDAILQTLNRWIGGFFMNESAFNPQSWENIPIIYQREGIHPDLVNFSTNPEEELKRINGKRVGLNTQPAIDVNGHPRLKGNLTIDDVAVDELINSKKISLSTGFFGKYDSENKLISTTPNHILLFEEGLNGAAMPVDIGAIILNSTMEKPMEEQKQEVKPIDSPEIDVTVIKNSIKKELEDKMAEETKLTEAENQVQILNSQLEAKAKETAALEARIKGFELEKEVQIKNTRADQWTQIKNSLAPGLTHEADAEKKLQAQFMDDPFAFSVFLAKQIKPITTEKEGIEHPIVNSAEDADAKIGFTVGGTYKVGA